MASIFSGRAFIKNLIDKLLNCQTKIGGACAKFFFGPQRVKRERGRTARLVVADVIRFVHAGCAPASADGVVGRRRR